MPVCRLSFQLAVSKREMSMPSCAPCLLISPFPYSQG